MTFARIQISEVADFINGFPFKPGDWEDSGKKIIRIQNLTDSSKPFNRTNREVPSKYQVAPGELLVSWSATLGVFVWEGPDEALVNQHIFKVIPDFKKIDFSYLKYILDDALVEMKRHLHGATMKHVNRREFLATTIPLPPLSEQKRIARILDAADALRAKRRESLTLLDNLTQSIFIDMFGDPVTNPMGWEALKLPDLVTSDKHSLKRGPFGGALKKEIFVNDGFKVYEQKHIIYNDFEIGEYFIDDHDFTRLDAFKVRPGDLLVSCSGTIGRIAIVPENARTGVMNQALLKIRLNKMRILNTFFICLWRSHPFERQVLGMTQGTGMKNMKSMNELKSINFITPPLHLQQRFASIVESIEKQKERLKNQLSQMDTLFSSLQQRAFNGEL